MPKRTSSATTTAVVKKSKTSTMTRKKTPWYRPVKVNVGKQTFPKQFQTTLKYAEAVTVTLTAGIGKYVFSTNGCYDPNITGTGHQPLYFDQLAGIYNHYTVLKSKCKVDITHNGSLYAALYIDDDTSTHASVNTSAEMPGASTFLANGAVDSMPTLYQYFDAAATFGPNPQAQDSLQGTSAANPSEQTYYVLTLFDAAGPNTNLLTYWQIEYTVVWDEFVTVSSS